MPFYGRSIAPRTGSAPWSSELVHLHEDDRPSQEGSAERLGVDEGVYRFDEGGKLRPYFVNGTYQSGTLGISDYDRPEPGYMETVAAAFRTDNLIASGFVSRAMAIPDEAYFKVEPGYDVYEDIKGYEQYADKFEQVYNRNAAQAVKADIDREKSDREILAASGWTAYLLAIGAANILDPTILIPGGAVVKGGRLGYSVGKSALNVGAQAGLAAGVQEVGLHATQQLRTPEESFMALGGSVILGGILGTSGVRIISEDRN
jgi:hypothetical protein